MLAREDACERFGQSTEIELARDRWMELQLLKMQQVAATEAYLMKTTNHSLKILIFMFFFSAGVTLFTARVAAQDEGWQIMRADYGFKAQRTDVTDILRDLVSRGGVNGRVAINNQTMGGDPAVGRDKSLRIFARNHRNEEREFDVNEGGFIDARLFVVRREDRDDQAPARDDRPREDRDRVDHDRGDRGEARDLVIIRGFYGVQGRTVNVTEQLRAMIRDGVLAVRVNNENFGGDPAIGADKVLIVVYSSRGQEQATAVREGERLVIP
jgi:hypothetical protein